MQQYENLEKLAINHQKLATKLANRFTKYTSWKNDRIIIFETIGDWITYEMKEGYLSYIIKEIKSKYPEIYESLDYPKLAQGMMNHLDPDYYYYDGEIGSIIKIMPEE